MTFEVKLEAVPCPLGCRPDDAAVVTGRDRLHDLPGEFAVVRCRTCGLMRTSPRPTPETIGLYYPPEYGPYHTLAPHPSDPAASNTWSARLRRCFHQNSWELPPLVPGRMLEVGCGSGAFLRYMRERGWQVSGVEFSAAAAARMRASGFDVSSGALETTIPPDAGYDLIVAWMVVEHLHDPVQALSRVRRWCRPGASLVISVPDAGGLEFRLFRDRWYALSLPIHLYHFTSKTIRRVLTEAGWSVERIFWHNNPNNLLHSLRYRCLDAEWTTAARWLYQFAEGERLRRTHMLLGKLLGTLRISGRMTVWARAKHD